MAIKTTFALPGNYGTVDAYGMIGALFIDRLNRQIKVDLWRWKDAASRDAFKEAQDGYETYRADFAEHRSKVAALDGMETPDAALVRAQLGVEKAELEQRKAELHAQLTANTMLDFVSYQLPIGEGGVTLTEEGTVPLADLYDWLTAEGHPLAGAEQL